MKSKKKPINVDVYMNVEYEWAIGVFEEEYITYRRDMDTKTKNWLIDELNNSYEIINSLLVKDIFSDDIIKRKVTQFINNLIFLTPIIEEYLDLVNELPKHYITVLMYLLSKAETKEKFEICQNISNFKKEYINQLIDKNILIK